VPPQSVINVYMQYRVRSVKPGIKMEQYHQ
jgi:hypothetical protein